MASLTVEEIVEINRKVGEKGTLINKGNLEFTVQKVEKAKELGRKAALLLHDLIVLHPFLDGNKRTAFVSANTLVELESKKLKITDKEALDLAYGIANGKYNISKVEDIISKLIE
ncbi:MAG: type II toxin-antitoxin system death-on-curing family toxin [Candidatus Micrarchaeota archaeon]|nr:type II toxin-antitoxin system death-on-curing family toxin [Candidatus Micrarchaeota archaeon]